MSLALAHVQFILPGMCYRTPIHFEEADHSWTACNAIQRLENAIAYCHYQMARWRHRRRRFSAERLWYLGGFRLLKDALYSAPIQKEIQLVLPALNPAPIPDPREAEFAAKPRTWLVEALQSANPVLTDRKLLSHLSRPKLAGMLVRALETGAVRRRA